MSQPVHRVFIGYDSKEPLQYQVCRDSMLQHASGPVLIEPLIEARLRGLGAYRRFYWEEDGQPFDGLDKKPFSTEFSFTRFLVPALTQYRGWALFCDSDFLWLDDVAKLFRLADPTYACMVVKHDYRPPEKTKMRGQAQQQYARKAWSSLVLWNCEHASTQLLTPYQVNFSTGSWLHGFRWLKDKEIGDLPPAWNWLEGRHSPMAYAPKAIHYTRGTPNMPGHESATHAAEWWAYVRKENEHAKAS